VIDLRKHGGRKASASRPTEATQKRRKARKLRAQAPIVKAKGDGLLPQAVRVSASPKSGGYAFVGFTGV
jgi:hypothetical protein